jgi:aspartate beta-hydroxylase
MAAQHANTARQGEEPSAADAIRRQFARLRVRRLYSNLIEVYAAAGMSEEVLELARIAVKQGIWRHPLQRPLQFYPSAPSEPLIAADQFWFTQALEASYPQVREEFDRVTDAESAGFLPAHEEASLIGAGTWKRILFWNQGVRNPEALGLFPVLSSVIDSIPEVTTAGVGVVSLSWLQPGTRLVPHCGSSNGRLRVHFAIKVPEGTGMRVAEEIVTWEEGKCVVFDDSFEHEVWHHGDEPRVVLILDVLNPFLRPEEQRLEQRKLSIREQIVSFMKERGLGRVEVRSDEVRLVPNAETEQVVRDFLAYADLATAEIRDGELVGDPAPEPLHPEFRL